jgi:hypothetical protein
MMPLVDRFEVVAHEKRPPHAGYSSLGNLIHR